MDEPLLQRALKKATWRLVPYLMLLYFVSFLNRVNIGFAALSMNKDIGLTPAMFGLGAGIFAVSYCLFEVPSNLILMRVGARRWIARILLTWGVMSSACALAHGPVSFAILRLLLGAAEAGFFPGVILYLTYWFPAHRRAGVIAAFVAAAPISTALGSPLSAAIMGWVGERVLWGMKDWQWLFVLEGAPAIILSLVTLKVMADRPSKASWLSAEEAAAIEQAIAAEDAGKGERVRHSVWRSLANPKVIALGLIYFGSSAGLYVVGIWGPQILDQYHLPRLQLGLLNAVPNIVAVIGMVLWARHSDRTGERTWHAILPCMLAAAALAWAANVGGLVACVAALSLASLGISGAKPAIWSMPTTFLGGAGAAAGIAMINSIGNIGAAVGPWAIGQLKQTTGSYAGGLCVTSAFLVISALVIVALNSRGGTATADAGPAGQP